jgi:hypothetical protein
MTLSAPIARQSFEMPSSIEQRAEVGHLYTISDEHAVHDRVAEKIGERRFLIEAITSR